MRIEEKIETIKVVPKEALRESLNKILINVDESEHEKAQVLAAYFKWLIDHYDNYVSAHDDTSCAANYGPEIVQSQS